MQKAVTFASLSSAAMQLSAQAILESADIHFLLWPDGQIAEAWIGSDKNVASKLVNQPIARIARLGDAKAIMKLVSRTRAGQPTTPIEIRHAYGMPESTSARYSAYLAGDGVNVVLIGTWISRPSSQTEKSAEEEISRLQAQNRQRTEARYQLLFEASPEAVFFVDPETGQIEEANANAAMLFGVQLHDLVGTFFSTHFERTGDEDMIELIGTPRPGSDSSNIDAMLAQSGQRVSMISRLIRTLDRKLLMIRVARDANDDRPDVPPEESAAVDLLRSSAVPIVISDRAGTVRWLNTAASTTLKMDGVIGKSLIDVFGISQSLLDVTLNEVDRQGRALTSLGLLSDQREPPQDAQLTIVALPDDNPVGYGFAMRMTPASDLTETHAAAPDDDAIAELVGKAPLKLLVRESTDVIERNCIEAALGLTGNNRAAAAQALGLSRQTLYAKLKQHGLF